MRLEPIIAHRGASLYAPENTLAAFKQAKVMGAKWLETDVMLTQDGIPILHHDETLERTTGLLANVADTSYETIKTLDAGSWFSEDFQGETIPTLQSGLNCIKTLDLKLNLEIKPLPGHEIDTAQVAVNFLINTHFPPDKLLISSGSLSSLEAAMKIAPQLHYGFIADTLDILEQGLQSGLIFYSLHLNQQCLDEVVVNRLTGLGYKVLAYTVNHVERAQHLFNWGVTSVFTDDPGLLSN